MAPLKLYGAGARFLKAQLVADFAGVALEIPTFTSGITNRTPDYLAMNPLGKFPVLQTPEGAIFESSAICRYCRWTGSVFPSLCSILTAAKFLFDESA